MDERDTGTTAEALHYSVGAMARQLDVTASTLRSWDRRYGIGPSARSTGRHRRYTSHDLARLQAMRHLCTAGVPTAEAARFALATVTGDGQPPAGLPPSLTPRRLLAIATRLDTATVAALLAASIAVAGVSRTWCELIAPALVLIGERNRPDLRCIEVEHALSACALTALHASTRNAGATLARSAVLLACAPGEEHHLPTTALAAALAEHRVPVCDLGPGIPDSALDAAIGRVRPELVFVWAQTVDTGDGTLLSRLRRRHRKPRLVAAGPGWQESSLAAGIERCDSLDAAVGIALAPAATRSGTEPG